MLFAVKLYVGGKVFNEEVQAVNRDNAIDTAKARNPHAKVIGVNPLVGKNQIMQIDTTGRIIGSFLIVSAYFIVLHVSATIGALMHLIANVISLPFFIRTKAHDVVIMLSFLMVISLTKLL